MQKQIFAFMGRRVELWTHPDPDHMAMVIRLNRTFYELDVLMKCRELYLPGTAIIDVGANIGNHAVFFGAILDAPVYAFEPYQPNHELLELNIAANRLEGRVFPTCCAIGDADGMASLHPGPPDNLGITRVSFGAGEVPVRSLDSLAITGPIGLLKVDVESAEAAVLRGAAKLIKAWLPDIVVEAGHSEAFNAVTRVLMGFGYVPRGRYAVTPTYLFSAIDQARRLRRVVSDGGPAPLETPACVIANRELHH
ncbi:MAG: FkbM family methyltransferase [Rhodopila sp.]|nr:FkbM family methyltransferase [Rhodopila sp.]